MRTNESTSFLIGGFRGRVGDDVMLVFRACVRSWGVPWAGGMRIIRGKYRFWGYCHGDVHKST